MPNQNSIPLIVLLGLFFVVSASPAAIPAAGTSKVVLKSSLVRQANRCRVKGHSFQILSVGDSAKLDNEEWEFGTPSIWIRPEGKSPPLLATQGDQYAVRKVGTSESPLCYGATAFSLSPSIVAITYLIDERPGGKDLGVTIYDPVHGKVIRSKDLGGFAFSRQDGLWDADRVSEMDPKCQGPAFYFRVEENRSEAFTGKTQINGHKVRFRDEDLGIYRKVSWQNGNIQIQDDPELTWNQFQWKYGQAFEGRKEFEKLAGWDGTKKAYSIRMIWVTGKVNFSGTQVGHCVQFAGKIGQVNPKNWKCYSSR